MMEALRTVLTGQNPVTALLQANYQIYARSSSRRTYTLSSWARQNSGPNNNFGCPTSLCTAGTRYRPAGSLFGAPRYWYESLRRADLAAKKIQRVLDLLPKWLDKWRMAVNVSKTAALLTGSQRNMPDQLRLRAQAVEWKTRVRYSGVHIDRSLRMIPQTDHVIQMSRAARPKLRPILAFRLPIRIKIAIYKCYVRSRLTYAAPAWYALCSGLQRQRLLAQQNIVLRLIAGAGWYVKNDVIARDLGVETIEEFVRMLTRRAFNRADTVPHPSLHNLAPHHDRPMKGYQLPQDLVTKSPDG
ncbi:RNA-directed DNA polymerase from mobile element jockey [Eumeta japonica]|uniref:RNA-directed DNA polymerase from mobile element jockey n=1 Tax=Eumeta variegata TaxID=151549 RepID=A0A4C1ZJ68_EUMVA|nr:RNA-directed DNA polymerase from mobile element jockey [Eumeta japonica]